jgi:hypothetical protein
MPARRPATGRSADEGGWAMDRVKERERKHQELREKRQHLHGRRRELHERLAEVCEDFLLEPLTREHRKRALVTELRYLLDYYSDDTSWEEVE